MWRAQMCWIVFISPPQKILHKSVNSQLSPSLKKQQMSLEKRLESIMLMSSFIHETTVWQVQMCVIAFISHHKRFPFQQLDE